MSASLLPADRCTRQARRDTSTAGQPFVAARKNLSSRKVCAPFLPWAPSGDDVDRQSRQQGVFYL
ncbi:MAG: hypothetical protein ACJ78X_16580, partial [Myxococcales bacterium]